MDKRKRHPGYLTRYAEHAGISKEGARKQLERVGINYLEPFDFDDADRRRAAARSLGRVASSKAIYADIDPNEEREEPPTQPNEQPMVVSKFQAQREKYKALTAKLQYEQLIGELVKASAVQAEWFRLTKLTQDRFMNISPRLKGTLAAESDPEKVGEILDKEIRQVLETLESEDTEAA